jgi:exopolysaccharide biosynthesis polyprenyl glycosylphosphotransferase
MSKRKQILISILSDFSAIVVSFVLYYNVRATIGAVAFTEKPREFLIPFVIIGGFWFFIFWFVGLYRDWYASSRYDEFATCFKAISIGTFILFFLIFADDVVINEDSPSRFKVISSRFQIIFYWAFMVFFVSAGRVTLRSVQRRLLIRGIGCRNAVIVGNGTEAVKLFNGLEKYPALGLAVIGFVSPNAHANNGDLLTHKGRTTLGCINTLPNVIDTHDIREVLIALESHEHERLLDVIAACEDKPVRLKIVPDMYDIISGAAKTSQIYGFPLIQINPQLLTPIEERFKRLSDVCVAALTIVIGSPFWLLIAAAIRLETKGPAIYKQLRIGKDGQPFKIYKFRSMDIDAESHGVPMLASKQDPRVTKVGAVLRKFRLDEFPQFWNVLKGDMSLVGPRPERQHFIEQIIKVAPQYTRLHKVRPGITSWGQVKYGYAETIEEMVDRMKYDLFYIENMSLKMDAKIILATIYVVIAGRGQ